eukprot:4049526-Alexandrium_andersonii.AAC.1
MSASLVGSEMCIRDSVFARIEEFGFLAGPYSGTLQALSPGANTSSGVSVSYTHLTLPTICSV